ncbi:hypothetical protein PoB_007057400 [Plakobranchus ocellatus]|uniref:Uncharacterized protein n=1 Tax=Plakobranchus ocellatus TaxID=259542 RepID=A0AAV4DJ70_9GAST|nr:hypothetical protein PoB_007057400 [Plakobranchus ocellatus]
MEPGLCPLKILQEFLSYPLVCWPNCGEQSAASRDVRPGSQGRKMPVRLRNGKTRSSLIYKMIVSTGSNDHSQIVSTGSSDHSQIVLTGSSDHSQIVSTGSSDHSQIV